MDNPLFDEAALKSDRTFEQCTPCAQDSQFHNLECGHRIKTPALPEFCGSNCVARPSGVRIDHSPFICPICDEKTIRSKIIHELQRMTENDDHTGSSWWKKHQIAKENVMNCLRHSGQRPCEIVEQLDDPKLQFFQDIAGAEPLVETRECQGTLEDAMSRLDDQKNRVEEQVRVADQTDDFQDNDTRLSGEQSPKAQAMRKKIPRSALKTFKKAGQASQ
ncbi:hypothetical protein K491DRAFT_728852 [Lophiostoma macrostomum CBS 122681]|uniref:Uncharacterized protein n=1 Tax=Lophiostoma macrostomum CBS 122681 TaxID=1314788 RepID=A0A6A6SYX6_9PLEO|nr:hypothetical protein K491DRAFT_728852 [Lophiostoma macrostomum CBS 122681]